MSCKNNIVEWVPNYIKPSVKCPPIQPCDKDCLRIKLLLKKNAKVYAYGIYNWDYENTDYRLSINSSQLNTVLAKIDCQYIWCTPYIKLNPSDDVYEFYITMPNQPIPTKINIDAVSLNNYILPNSIYPYASYDPLSQILTIDTSKITP